MKYSTINYEDFDISTNEKLVQFLLEDPIITFPFDYKSIDILTFFVKNKIIKINIGEGKWKSKYNIKFVRGRKEDDIRYVHKDKEYILYLNIESRNKFVSTLKVEDTYV